MKSDPHRTARGTSDTSQQRHGTSKAVGQLGHVLTCTITESQGRALAGAAQPVTRWACGVCSLLIYVEQSMQDNSSHMRSITELHADMVGVVDGRRAQVS